MEKFKPLCICCRNFKCDFNTTNNVGNEKAYCSKGMLLNRFRENKLYLIRNQVYKNPKNMISCRTFDDMFAFKNNFEHLLETISKEDAIKTIEEEKQDFLKECL